MPISDSIDISDIEENLNNVVVVTIDNETYKVLENMSVIESLAILQNRLKELSIKAIAYDIGFSENTNNRFYEGVLDSNIPTVFAEPNWLTEQAAYKKLNLPVSHKAISLLVI